MSKTYVVEELVKNWQGNYFLNVGEYESTAQVSKAINASPSKTKQAIDNHKYGWLRIGEYRIYIRTKE